MLEELHGEGWKVYTVVVQIYEVQEQAKWKQGNRGQTSCYFEGVNGWRKGNEEDFGDV